MKLTLQIKLLPTNEQAKSLISTLQECNMACDEISKIAWENKTFNQFKLHHLTYRKIKDTSRLTAQALVRCISKVADAYKLDKKKQRIFKSLGAITYDARILSYKQSEFSIWSVDGRLKIPFICHNPKYLPYIKGEADLVYKNNKFYLFQTVEVLEEDIKDVEDFIGCDFGLTNICTLSTGEIMSGKPLENYRIKRQKIRSSLQCKGTKNSKRVLKRLSGKEKRTASIVNHTIAKHIVKLAVDSNKGIALEDLKGIRKNADNKGKQFRSRVGRWNFADLRVKIEYKAKMAGIPVLIIEPRYTSQMCSGCLHLGSRNGESFKCSNCGHSEHADLNAARNIRMLGVSVNHPEKNLLFCALA